MSVIGTYKITWIAESPVMLPHFKGSSFKGVLGRKMRELYCLYDVDKSYCKVCSKKEVCPYSFLFESPRPKNSRILTSIKYVSKPYAFESWDKDKTDYVKGEEISLIVNLFGKGNEYALRLKHTAEKIDPIGRNKNQGYGKVKMKSFEVFNPKIDKFEEFKDPILYDVKGKKEYNKLQIRFLTPTIIKEEEKGLIMAPSFEKIFKFSLNKYHAIRYFYCGEDISPAQIRKLREDSKNAETINLDLQEDKVKRWVEKGYREYAGFVGTAEYDLSKIKYKEEISKIIEFASYSNIGFFASIGAGHFISEWK